MTAKAEAIAWHLVEALQVNPEDAKRAWSSMPSQEAKSRKPFEGLEIDMAKVNAQQARRVLDRIVGYQILPAPVAESRRRIGAQADCSLWPFVWSWRGERDIEAFVPEEYWKVTEYSPRNPIKPILSGASAGCHGRLTRKM